MADPILVVVFLRGGADALALLAPTADPDYRAARPLGLRVEREGDEAGHALGNQLADLDFRLHPAASGLAELFRAGDLSMVHATGLVEATRSHFDAEARIERAHPQGGGGSGWLGRWLDLARPEGDLVALAVGTAIPGSLHGAQATVAPSIEELTLAPGHWLAAEAAARMGATLDLRPDVAPLARAGLGLARTIERRFWDPATGEARPYEPAVPYPEDSPLSGPLMAVARAVKSGLGLRVATVDYGGWDTHVAQAGQFGALVGGLSAALAAFWRDLGPLQPDVSVVVQTEFGRRLRANASGGTDHGRAGAMMVLGPQARGGRLLGRWPGLHHEALEEGADLAVTTDHRAVLGEVLAGHMGLADPALVFPGLAAEGAPGLFGQRAGGWRVGP